MKIEIDDETTDNITIETLKEMRVWFEKDLQNYEEDSPKRMAVFSVNPAEDIAEISEHINAIDKILEWFGVE